MAKKSNFPNLVQARAKDVKDLCLLNQVTPDVRGLNSKLPAWKWLTDQYQQAGKDPDPVTRAMLDIANACLTQNRLFFNMSRSSLQELTTNSQNWEYAEAFRNALYPTILRNLYDAKIIQQVAMAAPMAAACYELIHPDLVSHILREGADSIGQRDRCLNFARRGRPRNLKAVGNRSPEPIAGTEELRKVGTKDIRTEGPKEYTNTGIAAITDDDGDASDF